MIDYENRPRQYRGLIEVYLGTLRRIDRKEEWFWRAKGKNGQIVAEGCVNAVERLLSARLTGAGTGIKLPTAGLVTPWRLVVFNRDGSVNREGALY